VCSFDVIRQRAASERSRADRINLQLEVKLIKCIVGKPDTEVHSGGQGTGWEGITKIDLRGKWL
jgi:hypothetical protein